MISRIAITSFTASLLLLPSHVVGLIAPCPPGTTVGIVGGDPACVQDDNCIFGIEYSEDGCSTSASAVSLVAYLVNETYTFVAPTSEELSCARSTMCRINPSDELCVGANEFPLALDYDSSTGLIFGADDPSFIVGPDACLAGGWIPQCLSYNYQLLSDLKDDPSMLANDNPEDLAMMTDYLYLLYYEDDTCTDLAGITPAVSGSALSVPIVSNLDLSCQAQAMCAIDPDSKICESIRDQNGETALLTLETRGDETTGGVDVFECDTSNAAAGQEECALQKPSDCTKSSIFTKCHFRYLSGPTLAQNPRMSVGKFDEAPVDESEGEGDTVEEAEEPFTPSITTSEDQYVYFAYYSTTDCSSLVGLRGSVTLEDIDVVGDTSANDSCAREVSCLFDPESDICTSLEPNGVAIGYDAVLPNDDIYLCDSSNPITNEDVCVTYSADSCHQSSVYPSCKAGFVRQDELSDPDLFSNEVEEDQASLSEYYYIAYYDNSDCTSPVGLRAFVTGEEYDLPLLSDSVTCEDAMACLYAPDGDLCKERGGGASGTANFTYSINAEQDNILSSCDGTLADLADDCIIAEPNQCTQSGVFAGTPCLFRIISASYLARYPGTLVGEVGGDDGDNGGMETSAGSVKKGGACMFLLVISFVIVAGLHH